MRSQLKTSGGWDSIIENGECRIENETITLMIKDVLVTLR
jgi:hypothetical protein